MHLDDTKLHSEPTTSCAGCHARFPERRGPVHAYVTASPECWGLFAEILPHIPERLFTDAYMAQHPDGDDPRQVQSVAVHLIALEVVLTLGQPRNKVEDIVRTALELGRESGGFRTLQRPEQWPWTIVDVVNGQATGLDLVEGVLESWRMSEAKWLDVWAPRTVLALYD